MKPEFSKFLNDCSVLIRIKKNNDKWEGSGTLFKYCEKLYLITAYHCIFPEKEKNSKQFYKKDELESICIENSQRKLLLKEEFNNFCEPIYSNADPQDIILFCLDEYKIKNSLSSEINLLYFSKIYLQHKPVAAGFYPNQRDNEYYEMEFSVKQEEKENDFRIEASKPFDYKFKTAEEIMAGASGAGLFILNTSTLVGLIKTIPPDGGWRDGLECISLNPLSDYIQLTQKIEGVNDDYIYFKEFKNVKIGDDEEKIFLEKENSLIDKCINLLKEKSIIIEDFSGSGKTTFVSKIAEGLYLKGWNVFYFNCNQFANEVFMKDEIDYIANSFPKETCIIIDDAHLESKRVLDLSLKLGKKRLIIATRILDENSKEDIQNAAQAECVRPSSYFTDNEKDDKIKKIVKEVTSGKFFPEEEISEIIKGSYHDIILARILVEAKSKNINIYELIYQKFIGNHKDQISRDEFFQVFALSHLECGFEFSNPKILSLGLFDNPSQERNIYRFGKHPNIATLILIAFYKKERIALAWEDFFCKIIENFLKDFVSESIYSRYPYKLESIIHSIANIENEKYEIKIDKGKLLKNFLNSVIIQDLIAKYFKLESQENVLSALLILLYTISKKEYKQCTLELFKEILLDKHPLSITFKDCFLKSGKSLITISKILQNIEDNEENTLIIHELISEEKIKPSFESIDITGLCHSLNNIKRNAKAFEKITSYLDIIQIEAIFKRTVLNKRYESISDIQKNWGDKINIVIDRALKETMEILSSEKSKEENKISLKDLIKMILPIARYDKKIALELVVLYEIQSQDTIDLLSLKHLAEINSIDKDLAKLFIKKISLDKFRNLIQNIDYQDFQSTNEELLIAIIRCLIIHDELLENLINEDKIYTLIQGVNYDAFGRFLGLLKKQSKEKKFAEEFLDKMDDEIILKIIHRENLSVLDVNKKRKKTILNIIKNDLSKISKAKSIKLEKFYKGKNLK